MGHLHEVQILHSMKVGVFNTINVEQANLLAWEHTCLSLFDNMTVKEAFVPYSVNIFMSCLILKYFSPNLVRKKTVIHMYRCVQGIPACNMAHQAMFESV